MKLFTCRFSCYIFWRAHKVVYTLEIIHLNSSVYTTTRLPWCCQYNHVFHCIRIYSSLLHVFDSVRRHFHPYPIPFHLFHLLKPLLARIEKGAHTKNLSNFLFEFLWAYQSLNLWIFFEFIIHTTCTHTSTWGMLGYISGI